MKKMLGLAVVAMLWGCGPQDEVQQQDTQTLEELGQQSAGLISNDPILGRWFWSAGTYFVVDVNTSGDGLVNSSDCWNKSPYWRYITFSKTSADGGSRIYTGASGSSMPSCGQWGYSSARFTMTSDAKTVLVNIASSYTETYIR
jgi:hypothetical protein